MEVIFKTYTVMGEITCQELPKGRLCDYLDETCDWCDWYNCSIRRNETYDALRCKKCLKEHKAGEIRNG
jgi:hypothetical protein